MQSDPVFKIGQNKISIIPLGTTFQVEIPINGTLAIYLAHNSSVQRADLVCRRVQNGWWI
jgi:mannose-6-phosphate isomerase-like protein (cupin superfamily)